MIDFHLHSDCSGDSNAPMLDMCRAAVERGLKIICFTEHIDFEPTDVCYGQFDYDAYRTRIAEAQAAFSGVLDIRCGIEVDYVARYRSQIEDLLARTEFDYVLGAAHYVDGIILEDHELYFPGKRAEDAYRPYLENTLATVETGWFDTLAHLDLCKRNGVRYYGAFDWQPFRGIIEEILRAVIDRDMALEINTSGLRQSPADLYPSQDILQLYYSLGGRKITIGSDAHRVADVASGIPTALRVAQEIGFESVAAYSERKCALLPINAKPR